MKKRAFPTIIAIVVFASLFLYSNKYEVEEKPEPGKDLPVELAMVTPEVVKAVVWRTPGQPIQRVENRPGDKGFKWWVVPSLQESAASGAGPLPEVRRGDEDEIVGAIRCFGDLRSEVTINPNATDTAAYGIGSDSPTLDLETGSGTMSFTLGDASPLGGSVYFRKAGDPAVYLVPASVGAAFRKGFNDLRSKAIFQEEFEDIASVTVFLGTETIHLERSPKGLDWKIVSPRALPADLGEASGLVYGVKGLKASRFVNDQPGEKEDFGFGNPGFRVILEGLASGPLELIAGRQEGSEVLVRRADQPNVYAVGETVLAQLKKSLNQLRTKVLRPIPDHQVNRIVLKNGTATFEIGLASAAWTCRDQKVDETKVKALLAAYQDNRVRTFLPWESRSAEGLQDLDGCPSFELHSASESRRVSFGKGDGTHISIVLAGENEVFQVPIQTFDAFKSLLDLVTPRPVAPPAPQAPATPASPSVVSPPPGSPTPVAPPKETTDPAMPAAGNPAAASPTQVPPGTP